MSRDVTEADVREAIEQARRSCAKALKMARIMQIVIRLALVVWVVLTTAAVICTVME